MHGHADDMLKLGPRSREELRGPARPRRTPPRRRFNRAPVSLPAATALQMFASWNGSGRCRCFRPTVRPTRRPALRQRGCNPPHTQANGFLASLTTHASSLSSRIQEIPPVNAAQQALIPPPRLNDTGGSCQGFLPGSWRTTWFLRPKCLQHLSSCRF